MRYLWQIRQGQHIHNPTVLHAVGQEVTIESDHPLHFHTDGDLGGTTPMRTTIHPRALRVLIPDTAPDGMFQRDGERLRD